MIRRFFLFLLITTIIPFFAQGLRDKLKERKDGKESDPFAVLTKLYDKDSDQKISENEIQTSCKERWSKLDLNQNNRVNEEELKKSTDYLKEMKQDHPLFNNFDKNEDAKITADEIASLPPKFKQKILEKDINQDGNISLGEYLNSSSGGIFQKLDRNKDESLDAQELKNEKLFQLLDQDKNQKLTKDEFKNVAFSKFFTTYDQNQDREVTWEEYLGSYQERFKKADTNHDGFITSDEVKRRTESRPTHKRNPDAPPKETEMSEKDVEELLNEITGTDSESASEAELLLEGF